MSTAFTQKFTCPLLLLCLALSGCATYRPSPLATGPQLPHRIPPLALDAAQLPFPEPVSHRFDASDGLDMVEAAMLAVVNNPDLVLARDDAHIVRAQAFAAGLLPDPQVTLGGDLSNTAGAGAAKAFSLGLSYDITALITRSASRAAARSETRRSDLALLWQEWQVIAQARLLFIKLYGAQVQMHWLSQNRDVFADRYRRTAKALDLGLITADTVIPDLTALQGVEKQLHDLERQRNQDRHAFNALLGLSPELEVPLQGEPALDALDENAVTAAAAALPARRPDLLALQAGYQAQDRRYRAAILAQFPALNVGMTRARDNGNVYSNAVGITVSLPIFNRNRGNIAIEQATRQKLRDEYQVRLDTAAGDVDRLLAEQRINQRQRSEVVRGIAALASAQERAANAFRANNLDALTFANLQTGLLVKRLELAALDQSILEQRVALQTLLGGDVPLRHEPPKGTPQ